MCVTYLPFAFDWYSAPRLDDVPADLVECLLAARGDVYLERLAVGLHARRSVHCVTEQTVAGHRQSHHSRHYGAWSHTDTDIIKSPGIARTRRESPMIYYAFHKCQLIIIKSITSMNSYPKLECFIWSMRYFVTFNRVQ